MKLLTLILFIIIIELRILTVYGQRSISDKSNKNVNTEKNANQALQEDKFEKAVLIYRNLLEKDPENPKLNFLVGYCYLNTDYGLGLAKEYLNKSILTSVNNKKKDFPNEAYYYLAKVYHLNNQFDSALLILQILKPKIPVNNIEFIDKANQLEKNCDNAIMLSQTHNELKIENLLEINSKYSDINPLFYHDGREVIFTSRRENPLLRKKFEDEQYDENIYYTNIIDEEWIPPYGISKIVNSINHESACWISEDGNNMILRILDDDNQKLYQSSKKPDGNWNIPIAFPSPINENAQQTFGSFSTDGRFLFFTSDRKGGYGGTDIYVSENLGNNKWGPPQNLGPNINSLLNEESPIMHENGVLFFSSQGHTSMGGFDIFASYKDDEVKWIEPFNMGLNINSVEDDFFYKPKVSGLNAYIASNRNGTKGKSDIYKISNSDSIQNGYAIVRGAIQSTKTNDTLKQIEIKIEDLQNKLQIAIVKPNKIGEYNFQLPAKKQFLISFNYKNKKIFEVQLNINKSISTICADQTLVIPTVNIPKETNIENSMGSPIIINSVEKITEKMKSANIIALNKNNQVNTNQNNILTDNGNQSENIFSILIDKSENRKSISEFKLPEKVIESKESNGNYIYFFGEFNYEWEAELRLKQIKENFPEAMIIPSPKTKKITN